MRLSISASAATAITLFAASPSAATAPFTAAKFALTTVDGSSRLSDSFSPSSGVAAIQPDQRVRVESDEIIRVQFTLPLSQSTASGDDSNDEADTAKKTTASSPGLPEQVVFQLVHHSNPANVVSFVPQINKANGKATWSQRADRLAAIPALASSQDPLYKLRLLVASSRGAVKPLSLDLGQLAFPHLAAAEPVVSQREKEGRDIGFYPWEERRHTFRKEVTEGMPGAKKSLVVLAILVVVPWVVLAALLTPLLPSVTFTSKPRASVSLLIASLLFLETIGFRYYRGDFTLFKMLPYFIAGSATATAAVVAGALDGVGLKKGAL